MIKSVNEFWTKNAKKTRNQAAKWKHKKLQFFMWTLKTGSESRSAHTVNKKKIIRASMSRFPLNLYSHWLRKLEKKTILQLYWSVQFRSSSTNSEVVAAWWQFNCKIPHVPGNALLYRNTYCRIEPESRPWVQGHVSQVRADWLGLTATLGDLSAFICSYLEKLWCKQEAGNVQCQCKSCWFQR